MAAAEPKAFDAAVNLAWMESFDASSGRLYYIQRETNETSWECPPGFCERRALVAAHAKVLSGGSGPSDEAAFLARVRDKFPPPPPAADADELATMRHTIQQLLADKAALEQKVQQLGAEPSCPAPPKLGSQPPKPPSWNRGASARFLLAEQPPRPPEWALRQLGASQEHGSGHFGA